MIKTILGALCTFLAVNILIYTFIAFIKWQMNPGLWTGDERFFMVLIGGLFGVSAAGGWIMFREDKHK